MKTERRVISAVSILPIILVLIVSFVFASCENSGSESSKVQASESKTVSVSSESATSKSSADVSDQMSLDESAEVSMTESERQAYLDEINSILNEIKEG